MYFGKQACDAGLYYFENLGLNKFSKTKAGAYRFELTGTKFYKFLKDQQKGNKTGLKVALYFTANIDDCDLEHLDEVSDEQLIQFYSTLELCLGLEAAKEGVV
jgi:hypothetical protein